MIIDARGLKHPEPLKRLKETVTTMCTIENYVDLLVDDDKEVRNVKMFAAMSGCKYEIEQFDRYWRVRIKGSTCMCG